VKGKARGKDRPVHFWPRRMDLFICSSERSLAAALVCRGIGRPALSSAITSDKSPANKVHLLLHRTTCITLTLKPCCLIFIYELA
jgi:hypothetical protein